MKHVIYEAIEGSAPPVGVGMVGSMACADNAIPGRVSLVRSRVHSRI